MGCGIVAVSIASLIGNQYEEFCHSDTNDVILGLMENDTLSSTFNVAISLSTGMMDKFVEVCGSAVNKFIPGSDMNESDSLKSNTLHALICAYGYAGAIHTVMALDNALLASFDAKIRTLIDSGALENPDEMGSQLAKWIVERIVPKKEATQ